MVLVTRAGLSPSTRPSSSASHDACASSAALSSIVCPATSCHALRQSLHCVIAIWCIGLAAAAPSPTWEPASCGSHKVAITSPSVSGCPHAASSARRVAVNLPSTAAGTSSRSSCSRAAGSGGSSGPSPRRRPLTMSSISRTVWLAAAASQSASVSTVATRVSSRAAL